MGVFIPSVPLFNNKKEHIANEYRFVQKIIDIIITEIYNYNDNDQALITLIIYFMYLK